MGLTLKDLQGDGAEPQPPEPSYPCVIVDEVNNVRLIGTALLTPGRYKLERIDGTD